MMQAVKALLEGGVIEAPDCYGVPISVCWLMCFFGMRILDTLKSLWTNP